MRTPQQTNTPETLWQERRRLSTLTCGFSLCTRLMQPEPYTTVFSGTTSHELRWQQAPTMQPLLRITFRPRSAGISHGNKIKAYEIRISDTVALLVSNFCYWKTIIAGTSSIHKLRHTLVSDSRIYLWTRSHCCLQFSKLERLKQIHSRILNRLWEAVLSGMAGNIPCYRLYENDYFCMDPVWTELHVYKAI